MKSKAIIVFAIFVQSALSLSQDAVENLAGSKKIVPRDNENVVYEINLTDGKITYNSNLGDQSYSYSFETSEGTKKHESGHFEEDSIAVEGGYEYTGDNGLTYSVNYVADKNGFRPIVSFGSKVAGSTGGSLVRSPINVPTAGTTPTSINPDEIENLVGEEIEKVSKET